MRSLAWLVPASAGEIVGVVGSHPPLEQTLAAMGAKVVSPPRSPSTGAPVPPLDHLMVPAADIDEPWLEPGAAQATVNPGGTMLVGVDHRWAPVRRRGMSARRLEHALTAAGLTGCRAFGVCHSLEDLRAVVPLDAASVLWYARHAFMSHSQHRGMAAALTWRLGAPLSRRALFPVLVAIGRVPC